MAALVYPGVTVMAQDPGAVGRLAAQRLFERMDGDHSPPYLRVVPTRLVVRGSGELPVPGSVATPA